MNNDAFFFVTSVQHSTRNVEGLGKRLCSVVVSCELDVIIVTLNPNGSIHPHQIFRNGGIGNFIGSRGSQVSGGLPRAYLLVESGWVSLIIWKPLTDPEIAMPLSHQCP